MKQAKIITIADYSHFDNFDNSTIVITATQNLKRNNLFKTANLTISFADLLSVAQNNVDYEKCINSAELRYLICLAIDKLFSEANATAYKNCAYDIEKLISLIIMSSNSKIVHEFTKKRKYGEIEVNILDIANNVINEIKKKKLQLSKAVLINEANNIINKYDKVVFVGFVFFNSLQEYLIRSIESKELIFINKVNDFIDQELLSPLLESLNYKISRQSYTANDNNIFSQIETRMFTNVGIDIPKDIIKFHEPFSNREEEFIFIAKEISQELKSKKLSIENIEEALQDYAVVLTKNKNELTKILNDALGQYGVFIPHTDKNIKLKDIYYSKEEFLNDEILKDNLPLTYVDKLELFNQCRRIKASGSTIEISDFAIGKFIIEVYNVVSNDLTIDNFKTLINTHWYLNKIADNQAIEDFYKLQTYFEHLTTIEMWKTQINKLIVDKKQITNEYGFTKHPLYVVKDESLTYIKEYIDFIEELVNTLKVNTNIKNQIQILIKSFGLNKIELPTAEEKEMLELFVQSLEGIKSNNSINVDYKYFADHIKELIQEYSNIQENDKNAMRLAVVNMENYTKFDYVYFPMFEEDKYPRILKLEFPYTKGIVNMLKDLGINIPKNYEMSYHLKMSRHIFKNVFSFTNKQLTFTYTGKEKGNDISISVYAKDISRATNKDIQFVKPSDHRMTIEIERRSLVFKKEEMKGVNINELLSRYVCPKQFYYSVALDNQICYKDKFLLNFYAKALIINRFFRNLATTEKEYLLNSNDFEQDVEKIINNTYNHIINYFAMFTENEKRDIRITSKKAIYDYIETHFRSGKFAAKKAMFKLGNSKRIDGAIPVKTHETLVMINTIKKTNIEFDISRNLDYLISSSGGKKYKLEHFAEIIEQLQKNTKYDDKLDLLNFASFKVNTQLNNEKYLKDGEERVKSIIADTPSEYSNMGETVSSYCRFCKIKNTCKGVLIDE